MSSDDDSGFGSRFKEAQAHMDKANSLLSELADEIEREIADELATNPPNVEYDLDSTEVTAEIPMSEVVTRLNRSLSAPFFAEVEGTTIRVVDVRERYDLESVSGPTDARNNSHAAREIITNLADSSPNEPGAPVPAVTSLLDSAGVAQPEEVIERLRTLGEIYEPQSGYVRTT